MVRESSNKIETWWTVENSNQLQKTFCDWLRRKFHDANQSCTLPQLEKVNKWLNALAQQISQAFWPDAKAVFELLAKLPAEQIQKLSQFWIEWINTTAKDLRDDIQSLWEPDIINWYMWLLLDFFNKKKIDDVALAKDQWATTNDQWATTNDKHTTAETSINNYKDDSFDKNRELLKQALQNKEAVQKDPQAAQHFNTPEFRQRKQRVALELEAKPGFKASVEKAFWQGVSTADLADMILTRAVIQENNIKTDSSEKFIKSYDALDGMLHFWYYGSTEFWKNTNVLYNKSYQTFINNPKPEDFIRLDLASPELTNKAFELASRSNSALFNEEFMAQYNQAVKWNDQGAMHKLQEQYPQQFSEIAKVKGMFEVGITKSTRADAAMSYNDFVWNLFWNVKSTKTGNNSMMIKTWDNALLFDGNSLAFWFNSLWLDGKFAVENWEIMMTNLFKKDSASGQYTIWLDRLPFAQGQLVPTAEQIIQEVCSRSGGKGLEELFKWLNDINDIQNPNSDFRRKLAEMTKDIVSKKMASVSKEDYAKQVWECTEKYRCATKLINMFEPRQWQYRYQESGAPVIDKTNAKSRGFYSYIDALNNTFYDQNSSVSAARMADFTRKVEELVNTRRVTSEQFFAMFSGENQGHGIWFVETRLWTADKVVNLEKFDQYFSAQTAPALAANVSTDWAVKRPLYTWQSYN